MLKTWPLIKKILDNPDPDLPLPILNEVYTGRFEQHIRIRNETVIDILKGINFDTFSQNTFADIFLVGCLFMNKKCADRWTYHYTSFGLCLKFNGEHVGKLVSYGQEL